MLETLEAICKRNELITLMLFVYFQQSIMSVDSEGK